MIVEFQGRDLPEHHLMITGDVQIWVHKDKNKVTQIMVFGGFERKYADIIGLGCTLADIERLLRTGWYEDLDAYFLNGVPGICFQHVDEDDGYSGDDDDDDK